jgi:DNA polymerase-3 subunit delta
MRIKPEQLVRTLKSQQHVMYWLTGDEPLLMQEAADQVRQYCREQGFEEREVFNADRGFDWLNLLNSSSNLSLFSTRKLVELRLMTAKLDDTAKSAIQQYLDAPNPDNLLLITSPKLEAATLKTKWFKNFEDAGVLVQIWPVQRDALRSWLDQRLLRAGIQANADAITVLMDRVEGNLLAAVQEIEKLKMQVPTIAGQTLQLDANTVLQVVADSSRYTVYQLVDAALVGDAARAQKVLRGLRNEGTFPLLILGALTREMRSLLPMLQQKEEGMVISGIVQSSHVFFNRKQVVTTALQRLSTDRVWQLLNQSRLIDQSIKGIAQANPWDELSSLILSLSGVTPLTVHSTGAA